MKLINRTFSFVAIQRSIIHSVATLLACFLAVILFTGCGTTEIGRSIDSAKVGQITDGKTTQTEIESWFGKPTAMASFAARADGSVTRWVWTYGRSSGFGLTGSGQGLVVDFAPNGIVGTHGYSETGKK